MKARRYLRDYSTIPELNKAKAIVREMVFVTV
jgi:hypothetical protein